MDGRVFTSEVASGRGRPPPAPASSCRKCATANLNRPEEIRLARFELEGAPFEAMDSGRAHHFQFNDVMSLAVMCDDQQEIDLDWDLLVDGGEAVQGGWLKDRYGLSWQIVPRRLNELLRQSDPDRSSAVLQSLLQMVTIDVDTLESVQAR